MKKEDGSPYEDFDIRDIIMFIVISATKNENSFTLTPTIYKKIIMNEYIELDVKFSV